MSRTMPYYRYNVIELFEVQSKKHPNYIALKDQDIFYTYRSLNERVNQFAYWLQKKSVKEGDFVAILLEPCADFILCILAIIKLGAVYIPLDILAPESRLKDILDDANPILLITNKDCQSQVKTTLVNTYLIKDIHLESISYSKENLNISISQSAPIYMMFTSGSTGKPKGVVIPHQAVVNLAFMENSIKISANEKMAQFSNMAFDGSTYDIWTALLNGATLVVIPNDARSNYHKLRLALEENKIKYLFLPTGYLHQIANTHPETIDSVDKILFGGEQINPNIIKNFIEYRKKNKLPIVLINGYGPTEATGYVCYQRIDETNYLDDGLLSSIGKSLVNIELYVLDEDLNQVLEGELYISGLNLAIGYHQSQSLNEERFLSNPFNQKEPYTRIYKTGDRVKRLPSGELICLGRLDDQVKVGGFRIHLNEIEQQLMKHDCISLSAVTVELGGSMHQLLTAYVVFTSKDTIVRADDIRVFLQKSLPTYMLPAKYVMVDELPLTAIGKVDKKNLDKISHTDLSFHVDTSSESVIEEVIKSIWKHLLNRSIIETHKNLFELGANSLMLTEACSRINNELQTELHLSDLLEHPTIHQLSRFLEGDVDVSVKRARQNILSTEIAIIGMSCRFPSANNIDEFWTLLCDGVDGLTRFDIEPDVGRETVGVRGVVSDIEQFDASFFGFSPIDASITDPGQRIFLECAFDALEHAALAPSKLTSIAISVFAGMTDSSYLQENLLKNQWFCNEHDMLQQRIATSTSMLSTQVSYRLNLKGKSVNVNTACSTGLMAVEQACQDLLLGQSDIALAGATSIVVPQNKGYHYQPGSIVSPDGFCRPFADNSNGTVFSNGAGVVVLRRLQDAILNNDTIYAVIKGRGVNNDGSDKLGFTAPSASGQKACIREAFADAGVRPDEIGFVEAHGTATALGDVIEINALNSVYREQTDKAQFCALGSLKANIGHMDVTAGIAGIIKTALCLHYKKIPPMINFQSPNPDLSLNNSPFFINKELFDWVSTSKRYAGVSSFGVGGTNIHLILSEHTKDLALLNDLPIQDELILLSAKTELALEDRSQQLIDYLHSTSSENPLNHVAYTLQTGREDFQWRRFGVGSTVFEIEDSLFKMQSLLVDEDINHSIVFLFSGQGTLYPRVALELMEQVPLFDTYVREGIRLATPYLNLDLLDLLHDRDNERLNQTEYAQPILFIIEYSLSRLLMDCGIRPRALIGHSLGEYVAACLAGVFSFEEGISLVCERGLLMASSLKGGMLAIECTVEECIEYQKTYGVELALHNTISHCVVSGTVEEIIRLESYLTKSNKSFHKLKLNHAFHSRLMESIESSFKSIFANITLSPPSIPIISNVTGDWLSESDAVNPDYWYRHLRQAVQWCKGIKLLLCDKHPLFVEVGPGQGLSGFVKSISEGKAITTHTLPNYHRRTTDLGQLLTALGEMWVKGVPVELKPLRGERHQQRIALPTYPFQRQRYWIEPDDRIQPQNNAVTFYKPAWSHQSVYLDYESLDLDNLNRHTWIIFKDDIGCGEKVISLLKTHAIQPIVIEFGMDYSEKKLTNFTINPSNKNHYVNVFKKIKKTLYEPIILHFCSCNGLKKSLLSSTEIDKQLEIGFFSILYLAQSYIECVGDHIPLNFVVITTGTQQVTGLEIISPVNAGLIGPCRVISEEHAALKFKLIDINPDEFSSCHESVLNSLLNIIMREEWNNHHPMMVYRNGFRWDVSYSALNLQQVKRRFKDNGVYLLTGGLGGIALSICECISKTISNPTFILLSRSKMLLESEWDATLQDPSHKFYKKVKCLRDIQALGATIFVHQVDVAELDPLLSIISNYKLINGVIHCAGIAGSGLVQLKLKQTSHDVLRPKVHGTYNLAKALQSFSLDFVVLMSSIAALVGEPGQVDYSAANACLDAFAVSGIFSSKCVVSINWNTWRDIGMTVDTSRPDDVDFFDRGNDISPQQGQQLFLQVMESCCSNIAISNYDLDLYATILAERNNKSELSSIKISRQDLNVTSPYLSPKNSTQEQLTSLWQNNLGIKDIGINDDFFALGGHSLKALTLIEKVNKAFGSTLTIQHLYKAPSIAHMSMMIHSKVDNSLSDILVPLKIEQTNANSIFFCHPASGLIYCFNALVSQWQTPVSIYGLQDPSIAARKMLYANVKSIADAYLSAIKKIQPQGPYFLVGYSFGGSIVYEIAHLLKQNQEEIGLLALIDSWAVFSNKQFDKHNFKKNFHITHNDLSSNLVDLAWARMQLLLSHTPTKMRQDMLLFKATELFDDYKSIDDPFNGWSNFNSGKIVCYFVNANHETILNNDSCINIIKYIQEYIKK